AHHIDRGATPHDAAIQAMNELFGPIIGITLVLMAVFIPAAFLPGLTGRMYAQFALVIAATALLSAVNAATLKPTQCALWLRAATPLDRRNAFFRGFNVVYDKLARGYARLIERMVKRSGATAVAGFLIITIAGYGLTRIPTGFLPIEDQGYLIVSAQLPDGASLARTQKALDQVSDIARKVPGVEQAITIAGISVLDNSASLANAGVAYLILKEWSKRGHGEDLRALFVRLTAAFNVVEDARILVLPPQPIQGSGNAGGFTLQVELRDGSSDFVKLQSLTQTIVSNAQSQSVLQRVNSSFRAIAPQFRIDVDRVKAQTVHLSVDQVFSALSSYIGASFVS